MTRQISRRLLLATITLATLALGACSSPTAPSSELCGGVYGGSGSCMAGVYGGSGS